MDLRQVIKISALASGEDQYGRPGKNATKHKFATDILPLTVKTLSYLF
jgi:hypothetical protein